MADVRDNLRGLVLSALEIKELTGWPDAMVEDYLNILDNLIAIANAVDVNDTDNVDIDNSIHRWLQIPEKYVPDQVVVTADYTTVGDQLVICNNAGSITVALNDLPDDWEGVNIKRVGGPVIVDGNGKLIDGNSRVLINVQYTSLNIVYTVETDSWNII